MKATKRRERQLKRYVLKRGRKTKDNSGEHRRLSESDRPETTRETPPVVPTSTSDK